MQNNMQHEVSSLQVIVFQELQQLKFLLYRLLYDKSHFLTYFERLKKPSENRWHNLFKHVNSHFSLSLARSVCIGNRHLSTFYLLPPHFHTLRRALLHIGASRRQLCKAVKKNRGLVVCENASEQVEVY